MLRPVRLIAPAEAPVTLTEAKAQVRVDHADDDTLLTGLIGAATGRLDGYNGVLGRCLVTQTWRQDFMGWGVLRLPFPDATVSAVTYIDSAGNQQTVSAGLYRVFDETAGPSVRFSPGFSAPALLDGLYTPVSVTFAAGYGAASAVPQALKQAILLHVQALYDAEPEDKWRPAYDALIAGHRARRL